MINLTATTDKLQLIADVAANIDVHISYVDLTTATGAVTPGRQNTNITGTTAVDIMAAPAAGDVRNAKTILIKNKHATVTVAVLMLFNQNATTYDLGVEFTLQPGEAVQFIEGVGWFQLTAGTVRRYLTTAEGGFGQTILASPLSRVALSTVLASNNTGYAVYVGRIVADTIINYVELYVTTAGAGAQTAEVGLFSTPAAPNRSNQTLTKIVATGTVDSLTTTGAKRNTTAFAQAVTAGTHLWACARFAMATTQPTCTGLAGDLAEGHLLIGTTPGALTGVTTMSGNIQAIATSTQAPDLRAALV